MSSKRKSPPTKLSTDGLNNSSDRIDVEEDEEQLVDQNDNKIQYQRSAPSSEGSDLLSRLSNEQFQTALQVSSNGGLEMGSTIEALDVASLQLSVNSINRTQNALDNEHDSCDSLNSDEVGPEQSVQDNVSSSRKQRLLLSVSSVRSETTTDSEYDSEPCLNGNELVSDVNAFPYDFLQASLKASGQITDAASSSNHLHTSREIAQGDNNHHQYHMYHSSQEMGKQLTSGHGKRTMDDVLKRLTSKMTTSASLRDMQPSGPSPSLISESDYYNRNLIFPYFIV